jgi:hypothetical protein
MSCKRRSSMRTSTLIKVVPTIVCLAGAEYASAADAKARSKSSVASAASIGLPARCATVEPGLAQRDAADAEAARRTQGRGHHGLVRIPVYVHIILNSAGDGDVSSLIPAQIQVLDEAFELAGFKFRLVDTDVTTNDDWYSATPGSAAEIAMKTALRRGGSDALNIYTGVNDGSLLGWATFPSSYEDDPSYDGVVVLTEALPDGGLEFSVPTTVEPDGLITYDKGDTGTHEVGHWLGLYHTFQDGCTRRGDRIDDTPAELEPQFVCVDRNSCPSPRFPATDPIHNFMDYVDDECMDQFTTDQNKRMVRQWRAFRER